MSSSRYPTNKKKEDFSWLHTSPICWDQASLPYRFSTHVLKAIRFTLSFTTPQPFEGNT